jgi:hypothetical protein
MAKHEAGPAVDQRHRCSGTGVRTTMCSVRRWSCRAWQCLILSLVQGVGTPSIGLRAGQHVVLIGCANALQRPPWQKQSPSSNCCAVSP